VQPIRRIGPWTLTEELGRGGNATVWSAVREQDGLAVALKVVHAKRAGREPYERFAREIRFLEQLGEFPGVLPVLASHLPEHPSADDRPWLAMPIARPVRTALDGVGLRQVVEAVAAFASTLARLAAEHEAAHRDIKPGNLYELDGTWRVGDFGLIALPDVAELTRTGRPLGPAHFMAFETLNDPVNADPFPADVYALAKTLWVLACGQNFPPQGHQPAVQRGFGIADARPEPAAELLDQLVERMTRLQPAERPAMAEVAEELKRWLGLRDEPLAVDLSGLRGQLLAKLETELIAEDVLADRKDAAATAARRLQQLIKPLDDTLRALHPRAQTGQMPDRYARNMLTMPRYAGSPEVVWSWGRQSTIGTGPDWMRYSLQMGYGLELIEAGELVTHAFLEVGHAEMGGSEFHWEAEAQSAPVGSVAADELLRSLAAALAAQLQKAAAAFVAGVPER
jgi:hypothetical protein